MYEYRITKYNPRHRNGLGHYLLDEWTCFSEIGKSVSLEEYENVEQAYTESATEFAGLWSTGSATVSGLENHCGNSAPKDGDEFAVSELGKVLKSVLRNEFWCRFEAPNGFVHIGWDFYMYVGVPAEDREIIARTHERGLFVEEFTSPYHPCKQE